MKLNLVPTHVSKERQGQKAFIGATLIAVVGIVLAVMLITTSKQQLDQAKAENDASKDPAAAAVTMSNQADTQIALAAQTLKDANLAQAMIAHNDVYPDFYTHDILPYIPPFFRIQSLSATANDSMTCTVTMVGTIKTYQQYADLALALMRIPGAMSVGRAGYSGDQYFVPSLTPEDQAGRYRRTTSPPIPDDPQDRLSYLEAQGSAPTGYLNVGAYGSGTDDARGAAPDESLITIQVTVAKNLQTPDPSATLRTGATGALTAALGGMSAPGMGGPGGPPGMGGPGGPPGMGGPGGPPGMGGPGMGGPPPSPGAPGGGKKDDD